MNGSKVIEPILVMSIAPFWIGGAIGSPIFSGLTVTLRQVPKMVWWWQAVKA
jgi:hypothetical protein